jgi:hypothetical protein
MPKVLKSSKRYEWKPDAHHRERAADTTPTPLTTDTATSTAPVQGIPGTVFNRPVPSTAAPRRWCHRTTRRLPNRQVPRADQPFRFLDLPPELRVMVYSYITPRTHRHVLQTSDRWERHSITLVTNTLPVSLLATCRLVHAEARKIFEPKLATLRDIRYHYVMDFNAYCATVAHPNNIVRSIVAQAAANPSRVEPSYFLNPRVPILCGTSEFARIDAFVKKCIGMAKLAWPRVVTVGLRFSGVQMYGFAWWADESSREVM